MSKIESISENIEFKGAVRRLLLNDRTLESAIEDLDFSVNRIETIETILGVESGFITDLSLGSTVDTYSDWSHLLSQTGYSIWKIEVDNFEDNDENQLFINTSDSEALYLDYRGEADAEIKTFFNTILHYDTSVATPEYNDLTTPVQNEGSSSTIWEESEDYLYIGSTTKFSKVSFRLEIAGVGVDGLTIEYYNSDATPTWEEVEDLDDDTDNLSGNGTVEFTEPTDWAQTEVDSSTLYWIRISPQSFPVTFPTVLTISQGDSIPDKLLMTSTEVVDRHWSWGFYNDYIYVSIPNSGRSAYEGQLFITSSSDDETLRDYFISNRNYKTNYFSSEAADPLDLEGIVYFESEATPISVDNNNVAIFSGTTGQVIKDSGVNINDLYYKLPFRTEHDWSSPEEGMLRYDDQDLKRPQYYNGTEWKYLGV